MSKSVNNSLTPPRFTAILRESAAEQKKPQTLVVTAMMIAMNIALSSVHVYLTPQMRVGFGFSDQCNHRDALWSGGGCYRWRSGGCPLVSHSAGRRLFPGLYDHRRIGRSDLWISSVPPSYDFAARHRR